MTVVLVEQVERLDPIFTRADLALAEREIRVDGATISGTVHNIGSADVGDVVLAVVDDDGAEIARQSFGSLEAPLDLVPRRKDFSMSLPSSPGSDWTVVLDPDNAVPEIFEGNNSAGLGNPWPPDYSKGWE